MRADAAVGAEHDGDARAPGLAEGVLDLRADREGLRPHQRVEVLRVLGALVDPAAGGDRRHVVRALLLHHPHGLVVHERAMLDRVHAGAHRALDALGAVRMRGDLHVVVVRRGDDGRQLLVGELRGGARLRDRQHAAGRRDLDRVRAVLVALAHRLAAAVGAVADGVQARVLAVQERTPGVAGIRMSAAGPDRAAGGEDARAPHLALLDRAPERDRHAELVA